MASHCLDDEGALLAACGAVDRIERLDDAVQGSVGADRHVGADHVVVDRADQPGQAQHRMRQGCVRRYRSLGDELGAQLRPLLAKQVRAGEAAVAANDDQRVDAAVDQVRRRLAPSFTGAESAERAVPITVPPRCWIPPSPSTSPR